MPSQAELLKQQQRQLRASQKRTSSLQLQQEALQTGRTTREIIARREEEEKRRITEQRIQSSSEVKQVNAAIQQQKQTIEALELQARASREAADSYMQQRQGNYLSRANMERARAKAAEQLLEKAKKSLSALQNAKQTVSYYVAGGRASEASKLVSQVQATVITKKEAMEYTGSAYESSRQRQNARESAKKYQEALGEAKKTLGDFSIKELTVEQAGKLDPQTRKTLGIKIVETSVEKPTNEKTIPLIPGTFGIPIVIPKKEEAKAVSPINLTFEKLGNILRTGDPSKGEYLASEGRWTGEQPAEVKYKDVPTVATTPSISVLVPGDKPGTAVVRDIKITTPSAKLNVISETERYRDLGYTKTESEKLARESVRSGGMSFTPSTAERIIKGERYSDIEKERDVSRASFELGDITGRPGGSGFITGRTIESEDLRTDESLDRQNVTGVSDRLFHWGNDKEDSKKQEILFLDFSGISPSGIDLFHLDKTRDGNVSTLVGGIDSGDMGRSIFIGSISRPSDFSDKEDSKKSEKLGIKNWLRIHTPDFKVPLLSVTGAPGAKISMTELGGLFEESYKAQPTPQLEKKIPEFGKKYDKYLQRDETGQVVFTGTAKKYEQYSKEYDEIKKLEKKSKEFKTGATELAYLGLSKLPRTWGEVALTGAAIYGGSKVITAAGTLAAKAPQAVKTVGKIAFAGTDIYTAYSGGKAALSSDLPASERIVGGGAAGLSVLSLGAMAYPKVSGYIRTAGRAKVPIEQLIPEEVLTGKKMFPEAGVGSPKQIARAHKELFESMGTTLPSQTKPAGFHATGEVFWKGNTAEVGEAPLHISSDISPWFLRISDQAPSFSLSLKNIFRKPGVAQVTPKRFEINIGREIGRAKGYAWSKPTKTGIAYIPGQSPEIEAILETGTGLQKTGTRYYSKYSGIRFPIDTFEVVDSGKAVSGAIGVSSQISKITSYSGLPETSYGYSAVSGGGKVVSLIYPSKPSSVSKYPLARQPSSVLDASISKITSYSGLPETSYGYSAVSGGGKVVSLIYPSKPSSVSKYPLARQPSSVLDASISKITKPSLAVSSTYQEVLAPSKPSYASPSKSYFPGYTPAPAIEYYPGVYYDREEKQRPKAIFYLTREGRNEAWKAQAYIDATKKQKAHWANLNRTPVSKNEAEDLALYGADYSISARVRVKKVQGKPQPLSKELSIPSNYAQFSRHKFRTYEIKKGKIRPLKNEFIEFSRYRIDTEGEKRKLKIERFLAQEKRKLTQKENINRNLQKAIFGALSPY